MYIYDAFYRKDTKGVAVQPFGTIEKCIKDEFLTGERLSATQTIRTCLVKDKDGEVIMFRYEAAPNSKQERAITDYIKTWFKPCGESFDEYLFGWR